ncbi:hypothetical protein [Faecalimicrobium sp. JNUCC 81]
MLQPTSLQELKALAEQTKGEVIEIPGFLDTQVLRVRVKPVSLVELTQCDLLPNALMLTVNDIIQKQQKGEMFSGKEAAVAKKNMETFTDIVYKAALVEPSYKDFRDAGIELNLIQKRMIAEYAIGDVSTLNRFRQFRKDFESNTASEVLQETTE